jgi:hypothetical protein
MNAALPPQCCRAPCARVILLVVLLCLQMAVAVSVPSGERGGASETAGNARQGGEAQEGTEGQTSETGLPRRRGIRRYLEERGVGVQDIPKALLVYESISMGLL